MRRSLAALVVVLVVAPHAPAPPPVFRPPPPTPRPTPRPPTTRPPTTPSPVRPPTYRPPIVILPTPNFHREFDDARRRSAAEAAELLRKQKALAAAQRAELLNRLAHEELLRKQANLADLRRLRAEWLAVGPGAGLDPLLTVRLEAAERAAEAALFTELVGVLGAANLFDRPLDRPQNWYAHALRVLDALGEPRYAPAEVAIELPALRSALAHAAALARVRAALADAKAEPGFAEAVFQLPQGRSPDLMPLVRQDAALERARVLLEGERDARADATGALADLERVCGVALASEVRAEFAARFALEGKFNAAEQVLRGATDVAHAQLVLEDLRAAALGSGSLAVLPQPPSAPELARAVLPRDALAKWKPPARATGRTALQIEQAAVRAKAGALADSETRDAVGRVKPIAERVERALSGAAAPLNEFATKVEHARGKPFASDAERFLAAVCGTHGYTVTEAVGALAGEAHRPACAARLLAALADPTDFGTFAVRVELAGRPPAEFAPMKEGGFKMTGARDRARLREAAGAVLEARATEPDELAPAAFRAALAKRLAVPADAAPDAEAVRALLDAARDWADSHARLSDAETELRAIWSNIERGEYGDADDELRALQRAVQFRRVETQALLKRRTGALVRACELLSGFGRAAAPAADWLAQQPATAAWGAAARAALRSARGE